jgi:pantoate--beta-alanine ligase
MKIFRTIPELRKHVNDLRKQDKRIGLVPTMGFLHEGHLSLIDQIRSDCDYVIVSIYINPKQFGPGEDLDEYPRDFANDEKVLSERGTDAIFYPTTEEIYPDGYLTTVHVSDLGEMLCGRSRPTHFDGVTTIVAKLFLITNCDVAAFGQKDYQQALIIQRMAEDLNVDLDILICPIVREADGVAMSSRNTYLTANERERATCLINALEKVRRLFAVGEEHAARLRDEMVQAILTTPDVRIDYVEVVDAETLQPLEKVDRKTLVAGAIWLGKTRLIDNIILEPE